MLSKTYYAQNYAGIIISHIGLGLFERDCPTLGLVTTIVFP